MQGGSLLDDASSHAEGGLRSPDLAVQPVAVGDASGPSTTRAGRTARRQMGNGNYAWIQHFLFHLAPDGRAGFVMANGALTTMTERRGQRSARASSAPTWWTASGSFQPRPRRHSFIFHQ